MYWITPDGNYYEGPNVAEGSIPVPQRPDDFKKWDGAAWIDDQAKINADLDSQIFALESASIMPRFIREYFVGQATAAATQAGISLASLITPGSPNYSAGFVKIYNLDQAVTALRRARK